MYRRIEKVAEDSSGVSLLGKKIVATTVHVVVKGQMAECLKKVVSGLFEREMEASVTMRKTSFKTTYINQVLRPQMRLQYLAVE